MIINKIYLKLKPLSEAFFMHYKKGAPTYAGAPELVYM